MFYTPIPCKRRFPLIRRNVDPHRSRVSALDSAVSHTRIGARQCIASPKRDRRGARQARLLNIHLGYVKFLTMSLPRGALRFHNAAYRCHRGLPSSRSASVRRDTVALYANSCPLSIRPRPRFSRSGASFFRRVPQCSVSMITERSRPSHPEGCRADARRWHGDESMRLTSRAGSARSLAGSDRAPSARSRYPAREA